MLDKTSEWFKNAPVLTSSLGLWGEVLVIHMQACLASHVQPPSVLDFSDLFLVKCSGYCYEAQRSTFNLP